MSISIQNETNFILKIIPTRAVSRSELGGLGTGRKARENNGRKSIKQSNEGDPSIRHNQPILSGEWRKNHVGHCSDCSPLKEGQQKGTNKKIGGGGERNGIWKGVPPSQSAGRLQVDTLKREIWDVSWRLLGDDGLARRRRSVVSVGA